MFTAYKKSILQHFPMTAFCAILLLWAIPQLASACHYQRNNPKMSDQGIVVFSTAWCPYCAKTKQYLNKAGINYSDCDIERSEAAKIKFIELSGKGVPIIVIGKKIIEGYNPDAIDRALIRLEQDPPL